ncbi:MAG: acetyl-CoA C-acyltransferase [Bifidobacteriaceae bacterium]|jgi:acetyl-CoA C-acetyltransferase|nr:acetyl-CoA C-acyltransferase [Bifidobacteriaceae bacterium]
MPEAVIVACARTPFGKFGGALRPLSAAWLGGLAIAEVVRRAGVDSAEADEVIMGGVLSAGQGQIPARQAAAKGGVPASVPALQVNKVCGSSLKAVTLAAQAIRAGAAEMVIAGGMESMSNAPYVVEGMRWGARMNDAIMKDAMVLDGLWCPQNDVHMAVIGGAVAAEHGVGREAQDSWALRSQQRWAAAEAGGLFDAERFPVEVPGPRGITSRVDRDEAPRPQTEAHDLAKLKPLFVDDGTVTAGNAPGTNDGAAALVIMSRGKAKRTGATVLATIKGYAQASAEPRYIATVPGHAIAALMAKTGLTLERIDRFEINEAFAAVPLVSGLSVLGLTEDQLDAKVNVNGGAVAVGHPIGATGARIIMTLINEMRHSGLKSGVAAICSGMAQGDAIWLEAGEEMNS